ncbi:alpha/beta fold hydrolase [Algibacter sp. PT7-4]|uniref:alpha/beta fold hydrolase n=1 Tax=Algibacter ulvanivorans TaxID=3400999 RepID=UPI003AAFC11D
MKNKSQIINNIKIAYLDNESKSKITIVFVHGNSQSVKSYNNQLNNTELNTYRLIALDLPGHGKSASVNNYSIPLFINTLATFCNTLQLKNYIIVGHSLGGHFTIQALPKLSHCIGAFIIAASPVSIPLNIANAYLPNALMSLLFKKDLTDKEISLFANSLTTNSSIAKKDIKNTDAKFREHLATSIENGDMLNEVDILEKTTIPIAIIVGENDALINTNYIKTLNIPMLWGKNPLLIKNALHSPQTDTPKQLNTILTNFIKNYKSTI